MKESFIEKVKKKPPAVGTLVTLDSTEVAEILSLCNLEWLFFDMEHGTLSISSVQRLIQAIRNDCSSIVRVPENSAVWIKRVLDTGCDGILVPQVNDANEARKAVMAAKFPPAGSRSVGIARAHGYGMSFTEYVSTANDKVALLIQIEHIQAVKNLDDILSVKGIDGVFIGPYDLSGSMNMLGKVAAEPVQVAIREVKQRCKSKSVPFGIFVMNGDAAQKEVEDGCSFIAVGIDTFHLANSAKNSSALAKGLISVEGS